MSAYTNTYINTKCLTKEQIDYLLKNAVLSINSIWYYKGMKDNPETTLKTWIDLHVNSRDYYINECGMMPENLTVEALTTRLDKLCNESTLFLNEISKVENGEITFHQLLRSNPNLYDTARLFGVIKRRRKIFVDPRQEIFRLRIYGDGEYSTVDDLMNFIRNFKDEKRFIDYRPDNPNSKDALNYQTLTPELEVKIREYYEKIGDGNFIVWFG